MSDPLQPSLLMVVEANGRSYRVYGDGTFHDGRGLRHLPVGWDDILRIKNMDNVQPPICDKCSRGIFFCIHERTRNWEPIDAIPTEGGSVLINWALMSYKIIPAEERSNYPGQLHKPHWATCPFAEEFRKR